jgi:hypothetical protein
MTAGPDGAAGHFPLRVNMALSRADKRRALRGFSRELTQVPEDQWPEDVAGLGHGVLVALWRSQTRMVLVRKYDHPTVTARICVMALGCRARNNPLGWDELQRIKRHVGFGDHFAVEAFPEDEHVSDGAPVRHLWVLPERPEWAWTNHGG